MPWEGPQDPEAGPTEGISGGPGPTPPGLDDGTPQVVPARPETPPVHRAGEERRREERRDPEEPDPS
ncbi:MAG TPA: hypothetical protein VFL83_06960 [Anaeromyxobacter sp.]|nr:hypothetical protein [Anaeromyxobacter sp.]